jgi:hypothetical protein
MVKIVIFLCDRYAAHRSHAASGECGFDRSGEPLIILYTVSWRGERSIEGQERFLWR